MKGLTQYAPFVTLHPLTAVTLDQALAKGIKKIVPAVTRLEVSAYAQLLKA
jgi:hypothetical protein